MNTKELLKQAKESLIEYNGRCTPTLSVEFKEDGIEPSGVTVGLVGYPGHPGAQREIMHAAGHKVFDLFPAKDIAALCLFTQSWVDKCSDDMPDASPRHFEAIVMQALEVLSPTSEGAVPTIRQIGSVVEIIRSGAGFDFLSHGEDGEIEAGVLEHFLEGFACAKAGAEIEQTKITKKDKEKAGKQ